MDQQVMPRVGIGVPTYNRPEGLRRTLACLSAQTYPNLDILVSDNASPGSAVADVVAEMSEEDPRIRYVRQQHGLGAAGNFRFVLQECNAEYFMWAADDDEWSPRFVEACMMALAKAPHAASAMTCIETVYRATGLRRAVQMPRLSPDADVMSNLSAFLRCMTPGLIYGIHRRNKIAFFLEDDMFDYYDCYFVLRMIASGGVTIVGERLYAAGVDTDGYQVKPMRRSWGSGLRYYPFFVASRALFAEVKPSVLGKLKLEVVLALLVVRMFVRQESAALRRRFQSSYG